MLRKLKLYGELAEFVGHKDFEIEASNIPKAISFLVNNFPQIEPYMNPKYYQVKVGNYAINEEEIFYPIGQEDIHIVPVISGSGSVGRILLGGALLAVSFGAFGAFGGGLTFGKGFGASWAAAGVGASAGAAVGSAATPIGTATGAVGGAMAGLVGAMETSLTLTDLLKDELKGKEFNKENIRAILEDEQAVKRIKNKSLARGLTIGMVEGLTLGLSRGITTKLAGKLSGPALGAVAGGVEMTGGALGELGGQLAAGQEIKGEEIFLEGIAEIKGVVNVADIIKRATTRRGYKINDERATRSEVLDILNDENLTSEELSNINIEVENDLALTQQVNVAQTRANVDKNIDQRISKEDRASLIDLEIQRYNLENKKDNKGAFQTPGLKTQ